MARLYPQFSTCRFDTTGERRFAERLHKKLEDDYLVWCNVPVGVKQLQPDFIVLHPQRGFLALEVKDWRVETIISMDRHTTVIHSNGGTKKVVNPLLQARGYAMEVAGSLQRDLALLHPATSAHAGKLAMPFGWGVVLTNITRKQFDDAGLGEILNADKVICSNEMTESVDAESLQQRLWDMFSHVFPCHLTLPQIDRVRAVLFPELRINVGAGQFGLFDDESQTLPDLIKVMDLQQEQVARSIGDGHRVIHGVAGSGKTMILAFRSMHLARVSSKPVLVLCYNRSLAARLRQLVDERGVADKVHVRNFHRWCGEMVTTYHLRQPNPGLSIADAMTHRIATTIEAVERGRVPRAQYAGIMIDEGHDFEPDWFRLVVQMLDPATNALLVLYDDAQSIYGNRAGKGKFTFSSVGIQAQGRTTILRLNYRNTAEVLAVAKHFATDVLVARDTDEDDVPQVPPESSGRRGPFPELLRCDSEHQEWDAVAVRIRDANDKGMRWSDMAVLYCTNAQGRRAQSALARANIPIAEGLTTEGRDALFTGGDTVKLVSLYSSKGLEFPLVVIPGIGDLPRRGHDLADEARLLYVGMTRALDRLLLTCSGLSDFTRRVQDAIAHARGISELVE